MKAVKLLFAALAMTFVMNANAQKDDHFVLDAKFGVFTPGSIGGFGVGFGYQKNLTEFNNFTLAWDVITAEYEAPFNSPADFGFLSAKTGLRLFSPSFLGDKWRAYTNLSVGYTCYMLSRDLAYTDAYGNLVYERDTLKPFHGFGLTFGAGLQFNQKLSLGYTLQYDTYSKTKNHFATIGWSF